MCLPELRPDKRDGLGGPCECCWPLTLSQRSGSFRVSVNSSAPPQYSPLPLFFAADNISFYKVMSDSLGYKHIHHVRDVSTQPDGNSVLCWGVGALVCWCVGVRWRASVCSCIGVCCRALVFVGVRWRALACAPHQYSLFRALLSQSLQANGRSST